MNGVVYIAYRKHKLADHIKEAIHSAQSIKKIHPRLSITLLTNDKNISNKCFDNVRNIKVDSIRVKQNILYDYTPYENTLFLDTDTRVVNSITDIFKLMERFDLAAAHDHARLDPKKSAVYPQYNKLPLGFSEFASGVMLFRKCPTMEMFFQLWQRNYKIWVEKSGRLNDQPSFTTSIWQHSSLKVYVLPPEFNLRSQGKRNKFDIKPRVYHWHDMYKGKERSPQKY